MNEKCRGVLQHLLFWTLVLVGTGLLFLVVALPVLRQRHTMEVMVEQMSARNGALYGQLDHLEKERTALVSDPFYIEKLARRDLKMCRAGEMQVGVMSAGYEQHRMSAEEHVTTARPVGLWRFYGSLSVIAEDSLLRHAAIVLGALTVIAGVLLFGRSFKNWPAN